MLLDIAADLKACKEQVLSIAHLNTRIGEHLQSVKILEELDAGNYYGYKIGPNAYNKQLGRVEAAIYELARSLKERDAAQSPQAKGGEAQLSARFAWGVDQSELTGFPKLNILTKTDASDRVVNYTTEDVGFKPLELEKLEPHTVLEEKLGFHEVIEMLAKCERNLREHPNPRAYVRRAVRRADKRRKQDHEREFGQAPERPASEDGNQFFEVQQSTWIGSGRLHVDRNMVRNAARTADLNVIADLDLERALEKLEELGVTKDHLRVAKAIGNGLNPRSANAHRVLGMKRRDYERIRRSLASDRGPGRALKSLRDQLAIYLRSAPGAK